MSFLYKKMNRHRVIQTALVAVFAFALGVITTFAVGQIYLQQVFETTTEQENGTAEADEPALEFGFEGETESVVYKQPDRSAFSQLEFPEFSDGYEAQGPVSIDIPLHIASADYTNSLNSLINSSLEIERHIHEDITPAMRSVQQAAADGEYLTMFENMQAAKRQIQEARKILDKIDVNASSFSSISEQDSVISEALLDQSLQLADSVTKMTEVSNKLFDSLDEVLVGSIPTQDQLDVIDKESLNVNNAIVDLSDNFIELNEIIESEV